jgi:ribosomal RNA assembly protein
VDLQLESGEYFLSKEQKAARAAAAAQARQQARTEERQRQREAAFVAPEAAGKNKQVRGRSLFACLPASCSRLLL